MWFVTDHIELDLKITSEQKDHMINSDASSCHLVFTCKLKKAGERKEKNRREKRENVVKETENHYQDRLKD